MHGLVLVVVFTLGLISPALAQVCCPSGCIQDFNPSRCVSNDVNRNYCGAPFSCSAPSSPTNRPTDGGGGGRTPPVVPQAQCMQLDPSPQPSRIEEAKNACIRALTGSAGLRHCLFETQAQIREDIRTGLSCSARQAAMART